MTHIKDTLQQQDKQYTAHENNAMRFEQLMQRIDETEKKSQESADDNRINTVVMWLEQAKTWLLGDSSPQLRYATLALAALLVGQTAYLVSQTAAEEVTYLAASGEAPPSAQISPTAGSYLVLFSESAEIQAVSDFLMKNGGQVLNGPQSGAMYRIGFADTLSPETLAKYENNGLLAFIGEAD